MHEAYILTEQAKQRVVKFLGHLYMRISAT